MRCLSAALFVLLLLASPARAELVFGDLAGDWSGTGTLAPNPASPMERGRCRVAVSSLDDDHLILRGRCAIAAGAADISVEIRADADGRLTGSVTTSAFEGSVPLRGERRGDRLTLASQTGTSFQGQLYWSRVEIALTGPERFSVQEFTAPAGSADWQLTRDLVFAR